MSTPASDQPALLAIDGAVATITLNRPNSFNSINLAIGQRLEQLAAEVEADDRIRVLVIEGAGRAFCGGGDIQVFGASMDNLEPVIRELLKHFHAFTLALRRMPKVVISSVHGSAAGAGLSLAFMADMCIAADDAKFTAAYHKLGISPDGGGTVGVTEIVGARRALQIFLADGSFSATQAYDWGMVAKLVPATELKAATRELAQRVAQNAPAAIAATKALIHQSRSTPVAQQLDAEVERIIGCMRHDDFREAVGRFLSKAK
ncbi:MAG: enoyl-CoA hydratase-related protein [Xanthobacteraceae bacterium]|nr:enoyl-CoA hydratase-related protein [Xanthobacteraceae bacterium]